jgi:GNAT superfamily N-acetyltransferase
MIGFSRAYNFIRSRELEGTFPGDPRTGTWGITFMRTMFGWGRVEEDLWPYYLPGREAEEFNRPAPPGVDEAAKRFRVRRYQRLRTSDDFRKALSYNQARYKKNLRAGRKPTPPPGLPFPDYLEIRASFEITEQFEKAPRGLIENPPLDARVIGAHAVPLLKDLVSQRAFEFVNSWGERWGDDGSGYMPYDFLDRWLIEGWAIDESPPLLPAEPGVHVFGWDSWDVLGGRFYAVEAYDRDHDERIGWSFAVSRGDYFDVEELYVRPPYRRRGYASRMVAIMADRARDHGLSIRAWVPFADCERSNREALTATLRKMGLAPRKSGVSWAAYLAVPGVFRGFDPIYIPEKPAHVLGADLATNRVAVGHSEGDAAAELECWAKIAKRARVSRAREDEE